MRYALIATFALIQCSTQVAARSHSDGGGGSDAEGRPKGELRATATSPKDESPPDLLIVSHGRLAGDEAVQFEDFIQPLQECGYPYKTLDDVPNPALASKLAEQNLKPAPIVLINAHGVTAKSKPDPDRGGSSPGTPIHSEDLGFEIGSEKTRTWHRGDEMVEIIRDHTKGPKIWLGTCYSGACSVKNVCLGTECTKDQKAASFLFGWRAVSRLLCDSYQGSCDLWESLDAEGTGHINSKTLEKYMSNADVFKTAPVDLDAEGLSASDIKEKIEEQENKQRSTCEKKGGKSGSLGTHYIWKYTSKADRNTWYDTEPIRQIQDQATATAKIKALQKDEKEFGSVALVRIHLRFFCTEKPEKGKFENSSEPYFPEVRNFSLDSARCGRIIRERRTTK